MRTGVGSVFVGRTAEIEELREGLVEARGGRGRLYMPDPGRPVTWEL